MDSTGGPNSPARTLAALLDELTGTVNREGKIREFLQLADVPAGDVEFGGTAREIWRSALAAATTTGRTGRLAAVLQGGFPEKTTLGPAWAAWLALPQAAQLAVLFAGTNRGPCLPDFLSPNTYGDAPHNNPGALLNARYQVVPFFEAPRARELETPAAWRDAPEPTSVRLFVGPGGAGKTRLFIHWCQGQPGWLTGFVPSSVSDEQIRCLAATAQPTIAVVDYAETRPELLSLLRAAARRSASGPPLRIVLLAREAADWWRSLQKLDDDVANLITRHEPMPLVPLPPDSQSVEGSLRGEAYADAAARFAACLEKPVPPAAPNLDDRLFGRMLYLHMAALAGVEGLPFTAASLVDTIVTHERHFWQKGLPPRDRRAAEKLDGACSRFMAAVTLRGGVPDVDTANALSALAGAPADTDLVPMMHDLYGRDSGSYVAALEPDLLGEHLVAEVLSDPNTPRRYLDQVFEEAEVLAIRNGFLVLGRIALAGHQKAEDWLRRMLEADVPGRARPALDAALALGKESAHAPLGAILAAGLEKHGTREMAEEFEGLVPEYTVSLREVGLWTLQRQVNDAPASGQHGGVRPGFLDRLRARFHPADVEAEAERARLLNNLSIRQGALGRREDALRAAEEAVAIHRTLAQADPDATRPHGFLPYLAGSLNNLGNSLSDLGRREDALRAAEEAVAHYRTLAQADPDGFLPDLAMSLNNLGAMLSAVGRREEALRAAEEAVAISRKLAQAPPDATRPDGFLPDLAQSLNNLGIRLSDLGRREDALAATEEAVGHYRTLAYGAPAGPARTPRRLPARSGPESQQPGRAAEGTRPAGRGADCLP